MIMAIFHLLFLVGEIVYGSNAFLDYINASTVTGIEMLPNRKYKYFYTKDNC